MAEPKLCSIPNCGKKARARGWCTGHYERNRKHGDPLAGRVPNGEQFDYLLAHMWDECPKWPYGATDAGRGRMYDPVQKRQRFAHQIVCEMAHGPRPSPRHEVAHNCGLGHKGCFGARCVQWKTREQNQMDRVRHGTSNRGTRHGQSRLTDDDARMVRALAGSVTQDDLARQLAVSRETIRDIQRGRIWAWLD